MTEIDISKAVENRAPGLTFGDFVLWLVEPQEKFVAVFGGGGPDRTKIEHAQVTLTINGVDLDVLPAFERLGAMWDETVRRAAAGLIEEKLNTIEIALQDLHGAITNDVRKKLGLDQAHTGEDL